MSKLEDSSTRMPVTRYINGVFSTGEDLVIREVPVTLFLNNHEFATMVCSPCDLRELAVGFLYSEGILQKPADLKSISVNEDNRLLACKPCSRKPPIIGAVRQLIPILT